MPVTFHDAGAINVASANPSVETAGFNIASGTDLHLLAAVCLRSGAAIDECRHGGSGGVLMTSIGEILNGGAVIELFELDDPETGSSITLWAQHDGGSASGMGVGGAVYAGVTDGITDFTSASGNGTSSDGITVPSIDSDDFVFDGVQPENADVHAGYLTGQTERGYDDRAPNQISLSYSDRDGVDGAAMARSWTLTDDWAHAGVRVGSAAAAVHLPPDIAHRPHHQPTLAH